MDPEDAVLELGDRLLEPLRAGKRVVVATAIDVIGSAPHPVGTSMAATSGGDVIGSVSAGCAEEGALEACRAVLGGGPTRVIRFGFGGSGDSLSCGGELDVLVHPVGGAALEAALTASGQGRHAAVGVIVAGPEQALGAIVHDEVDGLDPEVVARLRAAVDAQASTGRPGPVEIDCGVSVVRALVDVVAAAPRLVIAGATETAARLAGMARSIGWAVTVCDPRPGFATGSRFPDCEVATVRADEHLGRTPLGPRDAVCVLSHDEDLDPLAIAVALERGAGYVGALGSRATALRRRERLRAFGLPEALVARLHAPIGLDLGAASPAETAVSILAELIAARTGASGAPLGELAGPIHRAASAVQQAPDPVAGHGQLRRA